MKKIPRARPLALPKPVLSMVLALLLTACGGGDDPVAPVTELPQTLTLSAPATQQDLNARVDFSSNAADPAQSLTYLWDLGDGTTSTLAAPSHAYARPGVYEVSLTLSNEAGESVTASSPVKVADLAIVQGRTCSGADQTAWCWQQPLPQGNTIRDYVFVSDTQAWAVGDGGTLLASTDGGVTWNPQVSGTELGLTRAVFTSPQVGWVVSEHGQLLKTADGGASWQTASVGQNVDIRSLGALDADTAWYTLGYTGSTILTTDGGAHWKTIAAPEGSAALVVLSVSDIWSLPEYGIAQATLAHSVDGGVRWVEVKTPPVPQGLTRDGHSLQFVDARTGLLMAAEQGESSDGNFVWRQVAWLTSDGGATWQTFKTGLAADSFNFASYQLVDAHTVFSTGGVYPDRLRRTSNAGATWKDVPLPDFQGSSYGSFRAYSAQRLVVTDRAERRYLSTDGGRHWREFSAGDTGLPTLNSVVFFDARVGLVFGSDGSSARTTDGGRSWVKSESNVVDGWRRAQFLPGTGTGWAMSGDGDIYLSTDKGENWLLPLGRPGVQHGWLQDFHFIDAQRGWAVSGYSWTGQGLIYASVDGGLNWTPVEGTNSLSGLASIRFADAKHGVAVGPVGVAIVSADGGLTWTPRPTGIDQALNHLSFVDGQTVVAVGEQGAIVRSIDRGQTWKRVASPTTQNLNEVRFVSRTTGHAVGAAGTLLVTRDGGLSWSLQDTGAVAELQSVYFVNEQTGWAVGADGNILATVSGGQ